MTQASDRAVLCGYCGRAAELVSGARIYPHRPDLSAKRFWSCEPCEAWVGCHPNTTRPLGRLADAKLRRAKMRVHGVLDPLWRDGSLSRSEAYRRLGKALGLPPSETHVGMFDVETCERAYQAIRAGLREDAGR